MKKALVVGQGFLLTFQLAIPAVRADLLNPHLRPESCLSCHTKVPTEEEARAGDYFCIKESIDATCAVCHLNYHGREQNHPSDIADWNHERVTAPLTVPLFNGKITCNTCHLHLLPDEPSVNLLRKVTVDDNFNFDWTGLCHDCHVGY